MESLDGLAVLRCEELRNIGGALELRLLPALKSAYFQRVEKLESVSIGGDFKDAEVHVPCVAGGLLGSPPRRVETTSTRCRRTG